MKSMTTTVESIWDYLMQEGIMDAEQVRELLARGDQDWIPIGKILVQEMILTMVQLMKVLEMQADQPRARLGDLAVSAGFCTEEDIAGALQLQRQRSRHPVEYLLESPAYRNSRVFSAIGEYIRLMEFQVRRMADLVEAVQEGRKASA